MSGTEGSGVGTVLVGYDGSMSARLALDWAAETARQQDKRLVVLHTVDPAASGVFAFDPDVIASTMREYSDAVLDTGMTRAARVLPKERVSVHRSVGSPASQLVEASAHVDLVVLGTRGRSRLTGGVVGSTAYAVSAHAHCPVVVVRQLIEHLADPVLPGPRHRVVVGVDDSEQAGHALDRAAEVAAHAGAPLHVVRVAGPATLEAWTYEEAATGEDERTHELREHAAAAVEAMGERARQQYPDLDVDTEVLYGDPGRTLAELSLHAGLVVVGSRGRGGFAGLLLGSVSHTVIHEATCPVMIVR